jgi:hypothetical protein
LGQRHQKVERETKGSERHRRQTGRIRKRKKRKTEPKKMDSRTENEVVEKTPPKWDEREDSSADRVKGHTLEIEKELGTIAKVIKKEQQGKISFTKEEQKRILEASGTIRASVMQLLLKVIATQQAQKRAEERAAKQEEETEKLKKQLKRAEESGKGAKSQVSMMTKGVQTEGAAGKKGQPQAKETPKEVQARETTQTRKEAGSKGEESRVSQRRQTPKREAGRPSPTLQS